MSRVLPAGLISDSLLCSFLSQLTPLGGSSVGGGEVAIIKWVPARGDFNLVRRAWSELTRLRVKLLVGGVQRGGEVDPGRTLVRLNRLFGVVAMHFGGDGMETAGGLLGGDGIVTAGGLLGGDGIVSGGQHGGGGG